MPVQQKSRHYEHSLPVLQENLPVQTLSRRNPATQDISPQGIYNKNVIYVLKCRILRNFAINTNTVGEMAINPRLEIAKSFNNELITTRGICLLHMINVQNVILTKTDQLNGYMVPPQARS